MQALSEVRQSGCILDEAKGIGRRRASPHMAPRPWEDSGLYPKALEGPGSFCRKWPHWHFVKIPLAPLRGLSWSGDRIEEPTRWKTAGGMAIVGLLQVERDPDLLSRWTSFRNLRTLMYPQATCMCTVENGFLNISLLGFGRGSVNRHISVCGLQR